MKQKLVHFKRDNILIDANEILGVYIHDKEKGLPTIDMKNGADAYEFDKTKYNEVISAIESREKFDGLMLEIN